MGYGITNVTYGTNSKKRQKNMASWPYMNYLVVFALNFLPKEAFLLLAEFFFITPLAAALSIVLTAFV